VQGDKAKPQWIVVGAGDRVWVEADGGEFPCTIAKLPEFLRNDVVRNCWGALGVGRQSADTTRATSG
jgi:hypothetical protein